MAEIRCPMCGKPNPAELDVCQFCQARLKPLSMAQPSSGDDAPDWLRALRGKEEKPVDDSAQQEGESTEDWLARIRERSKADQTPEPPAEPIEIPDWLKSGAETPAVPTPPPPVEPSSSDPDWLLRLRAREEISQASHPGEEIPEWLKNLKSEPPAPEEASEPAVPPLEENVPEWLKNLSQEPAAEPTAPAETPGWLSGFTAEIPSETPAAEPSEPGVQPQGEIKSPAEEESITPAGETPGISSTLPQSIEPAADIPEWLKSFAPEESTISAQEAPIIPPADEETLQGSASVETPGEPQAAAPIEGETPSEEVNAFAAEPFAEAQVEPPTAEVPLAVPAETEQPSEPAGEAPDWLAGLMGGSLPGTPKGTAEETPDWLKAFAEEPSAEASVEPVEETPVDVPDWLKTFTGEALSSESAGMDEIPTGEAAAPPAEEVPAWLSRVTGEPEPLPSVESSMPVEPGSTPEEIAAAAEILNGKTPDWLQGLKESEEPAVEMAETQPMAEESAEKLVSSELPDWLSQITPMSTDEPQAPPPTAETPAESGGSAGLTQSDLPGWVKAMRPVEASIPQAPVESAETSQVEKSGPLAGLSDVLPLGAGSMPYTKPPVYSMKLQVTEVQQMRAALLDDVLAGEGQSAPTSSEQMFTSSVLLRGLVAVILLAVALIPILWGSSFLPIPESLSVEAAPVYTTIETLPADSTVLLVADFNPSLSGEMDAASVSVVEHLMNKGANIVLFSTVPLGPVMGENLVTTALRGQADAQNAYANRSKLFNLGFLPGGAAALQQFAASPSGAVTSGLDSTNPWLAPALQKVKTLADFDQVILVTDDPDLARAWVEQTGAVLQNKPLAVISSAQAAPLIVPYVDSGQVRGMVTGLAGGLAYEQVTQRPLHTGLWDAYQAVLVAAVILIILGALFNALRSLLNRRKPNREANR